MFHIIKYNHSRTTVKTLFRTYRAQTNRFGFKRIKENVLAKEVNSAGGIENRVANSNLLRLISKYRDHGHKKAEIDPLNRLPRISQELECDLSEYGLFAENTKHFDLSGILHMPTQTEANLSEIVDYLERTYCGYLSVELNHISDEQEKLWIADKVEQSTQLSITPERKKHYAKLLMKAKAFDDFVAKKYPTLKRYCGAGAESTVAFVEQLFSLASCDYGIEEIVIGMAHRGKLEILACLLGFPPAKIFSKIMGLPEFPPEFGSGDVLSHLSSSSDLDYGGAKPLHVTLIPNPSHLEAQDPVACGKTRAKQLRMGEGHYSDDPQNLSGDKIRPCSTHPTRSSWIHHYASGFIWCSALALNAVDEVKKSCFHDQKNMTMCLQIHGDAAFAAQGIVAETLCLANLPHFSIGGSLHLIVNNQLGFTTPPEQGRSSRYSSDVGKMIECPVFHVNGDYPEEVIRACRLAMEYRMKYRKDVIVDMLCYRRWGHNEMDEPSFTQPTMYSNIVSRDRVPDLYMKQVADQGIDVEDVTKELEEYKNFLSNESKRAETFESIATHLSKQWSGIVPAQKGVISHYDTGCDLDTLLFVGGKSCEIPNHVTIHPHLRKTHCDSRMTKLRQDTSIDWASAEALAFGSLLYQGHNVRISGQDVGRGTFSQRHVMFVDQETDKMYIPFNHMIPDQQSFLEVCNSPLSEEAVLGFEYGMSIEDPSNLIIWEAQFGDFYNGAQIIVDQFIVSGESKWLLQSGLVMLLPHGMDGMGPEHSSCRIERFLQLSDSGEDVVDGDSVNIHIVNPTTPAQYFHLLRRQILRNFRKPLIVASPKQLLRSSVAVSTLDEMSPGTHFRSVLGDTRVDPNNVKRVMFCSGKYYYTLAKELERKNITDTALVRLEALTPFPVDEIKTEIQRYSNANAFFWCQEEHRNMGAWTFVMPRFENLIGVKLQYIGRQTLAAPAVGVSKIHEQESASLLDDAF